MTLSYALNLPSEIHDSEERSGFHRGPPSTDFRPLSLWILLPKAHNRCLFRLWIMGKKTVSLVALSVLLTRILWSYRADTRCPSLPRQRQIALKCGTQSHWPYSKWYGGNLFVFDFAWDFVLGNCLKFDAWDLEFPGSSGFYSGTEIFLEQRGQRVWNNLEFSFYSVVDSIEIETRNFNPVPLFRPAFHNNTLRGEK